MRIEWRPGYHARIEAQKAWEEIDKIRLKNGGNITPEDVIAKAKAKTNPLHSVFDWDDTEAAHLWRMEQARSLLRSLHIISEKPEEQPRRILELKRIAATENQPPRNVYAKMEDIMADPEARAELLARALRELLAFRQRYRQLQELAIVFRSADEVLERVEM